MNKCTNLESLTYNFLFDIQSSEADFAINEEFTFIAVKAWYIVGSKSICFKWGNSDPCTNCTWINQQAPKLIGTFEQIFNKFTRHASPAGAY